LHRDILATLEKGDFILGNKVYKLEEKLANYANIKECVTCASGTDALLIPLMAYGIGGPKDAIFTTNFSFFSTAEVISLVKANPVFVDINPITFNICPESLELNIKRTLKEDKLIPKAIIAVDLFGQLADYEAIQKIAKKYNLILVEDAAQSFGASYKSQNSCSFGDVAATSFYPSKPLGCYGDGGAIFTNDTKMANIFRSIRVHGQGKNKYDNIRIGLNSRLDTIQADVLLNKLQIFDDELDKRNSIADIYLKNINRSLIKPFIKKENYSSWAQYSLLASSEKERNNLTKYLNKNNIPTAIFYKKPFSSLSLYKEFSNDKFPISEKISKQIFSIPMHPYLSNKNIDKIVNTIDDYFNKSNSL